LNLNPGDLCLCGHTHEAHFGHECSKVGCPCEQFALIDAGVEMFKALEGMRNHMVGLKAYLATCDTEVIVENLETIIAALGKQIEPAEAAIRKAKGE
jgi:hypothetical protein